MDATDGEAQRNKAHKGKTTGNKASKRDATRKRRAGIDTEPNRGSNAKAFAGVRAGSHKAQKFLRSIEKRETALHMPTLDKTLRHLTSEPPLLVAVVGPPGVGKTTLIRSMVKFYSSRSLHMIRGPVTVVAGHTRRLTFLECPNTLTAMCDVAKVADVVLLMIDGSYGFEMETFEFLNIAQVHGFPRVLGVVAHLDQLKTGKALKKRKKFLRHRFWHEVAAGAKLLCLAPMIRGLYRPTDVLHLHRLLVCIEPKIQAWRNTHSCVLIDRHEDITDPARVAATPSCNRTIAFYGYVRGKPMRAGQRVHIPGYGDAVVRHLAQHADPCEAMTSNNNNNGNKTVATGHHRMRHLSTKHKKLYAPYSDVGGITYDEDAIYVHDDAEKAHIVRTGEGVELLRELQTATPMDVARTQLRVVQPSFSSSSTTMTRRRRPVVFREDDGGDVRDDDDGSDDGSDDDDAAVHGGDGLTLAMDDVHMPSDNSDDDSDKDEDDYQTLPHATPSLDAYGLSTRANDDNGNDGDDASNADDDDDGAAELAPRARDAADSVRVHRVAHAWSSDAALLRALKDLCVTGNWRSGEAAAEGDGEGGNDDDGGEEKGYESADDEFDAIVRGEAAMPSRQHANKSDDDDDDTAAAHNNKDDDDDDDDDDEGKLAMTTTTTRRHDALAGVSYARGGAQTMHGSTQARQPCTRSGRATTAAAHGDDDGDAYDILADEDASSSQQQQSGAAMTAVSSDAEVNALVSSFLAHGSHATTATTTTTTAGTRGADDGDDDGVHFYNASAAAKATARRGEDNNDDDDDNDAAVTAGATLSAAQERLLQKKMAKKRLFDAAYDAGDADGANGKNATYSHYYAMQQQVAEKQARLDAALRDAGEDVAQQVQLVGFYSGLYVRFVLDEVPVEFVRHFDPTQPLLAGGVNAGEDEYRVVHARLKRHRWYPKVLKAQDPLLLSMGWRRFQTQPLFATEDANGRLRYLKYTPLHMHCLATFYAPVAPANTGFVAIPVPDRDGGGTAAAHFRLPCTGYTIGNDVSACVVKKLKLTGTPAKIDKTTVFIKGMFSSDLEAAKFVGAKVKAVSGVRGIIKAVLKGKNGLVRATFEDRLFHSDIVFIRAWVPVEPPRYCSLQRNLLDPQWCGMRSMRELRRAHGVPLRTSADSAYTEIKRRHRAAADDDNDDAAKAQGGGGSRVGGVLLSRNMRMQLPYDMKEEFIPLERSSALRERLQAATTVVPEAREQRRRALLDVFADRADAMTRKKAEAKKRARERAARAAEKENEQYLRGLKRAKKETARATEFRSQHKSRK